MILLIDNYDSFTWNIVHLLRRAGAEVRVERNDALSVAGALALRPSGVVLGPGPGVPRDAGITMDMVAASAEAGMPLLGICLGHQAIGEHFGARLLRSAPMHGKTSRIAHDESGLFADLPQGFEVARYNSLSIADVPPPLLVNAHADDGTVQGVRHAHLPIYGVQYHPESIASRCGLEQLGAFLRMTQDAAPALA